MLQKYRILFLKAAVLCLIEEHHGSLWQTKLKHWAAALSESCDSEEASPPSAQPQPGQEDLPLAPSSQQASGMPSLRRGSIRAQCQNCSKGVTVLPTITHLGSTPLAKLCISMENNRLLCLPKVEIIPIERHLTGT